jgi:hypothetical protein
MSEELIKNFSRKSKSRGDWGGRTTQPRAVQVFDSLEEELTEEENLVIEGFFEEGESYTDLKKIKSITKTVKSIQKQSYMLIGEQLFEAKKIFDKKVGKERDFSKWLDLTFSSRKTAYNILNYYQLESKLSVPMKNKLREIPLKAAYAISSNSKLEMGDKKQIIKEYEGETSKEVILKVKRLLDEEGESSGELRDKIQKSLWSIDRALAFLVENKTRLRKVNKEVIREFIDEMTNLI